MTIYSLLIVGNQQSMKFTEEFLKDLINANVVGDTIPFKTGKISKVESYITTIIGRIQDDRRLIVEPDYQYYGSGFASYVNVRISQKDRSDTKITREGSERTEWIKGLLLYLSNLSPYWYYGGSEWTITYENDTWKGGSSSFLRPEDIHHIDQGIWSNTIYAIKELMGDYGYRLLTEEELEERVWFETTIPTVLADKPYEVFDCFFYWED